MRTRTTLATGAVALALLASACGSSSTPNATAAPTSSRRSATPTTPGSPGGPSSLTPPTSVAGAVNPNAPEVVAPGDIPDNQVFVAAAASDGSFTVKVPEGWARTETKGAVVFTDKYNTVTIQSMRAVATPTVASVKTSGLSDVSGDPTFKLTGVQPVTRKSGDGVIATYEIGSTANTVTGKKALLSVERYVFFHNGTDAVLTLSGAKGSDNLDPWKTVTDSLVWK
ncbi:MAG: hypothetical protein ABIQ39_02915 [Ilumatobacteraceae bacterium]